MDEVIHPKVFRAVVTLPLRNALPGDGLQPLRDLDQIRNFISSGGPAAFADMPFLPIQITICFLIHPLIGYVMTIFGAVVIFFLTLATDMTVRSASLKASEKGSQRLAVIEAGRRNAEVLRSLGMAGRLADRWGEVNRSYEASHLKVLEKSGAFSGASRVFRMMFQSARARPRRLSGDRAGRVVRHHHRRVHPQRPRPAAGRAAGGELARLCRQPPGLASAEPASRPVPRHRGADAAAGAEGDADRREPGGGAARLQPAVGGRRQLRAQAPAARSASSARAAPASRRWFGP